MDCPDNHPLDEYIDGLELSLVDHRKEEERLSVAYSRVCRSEAELGRQRDHAGFMAAGWKRQAKKEMLMRALIQANAWEYRERMLELEQRLQQWGPPNHPED